MTNIHGKACIMVVLAGLIPASASAAMIVQTKTEQIFPSGDASINLMGFNSTLGTLSKVDLSLTTQTSLSSSYRDNCGFGCGPSSFSLNYSLATNVFVGSNVSPITQSSHLFSFTATTVSNNWQSIFLQTPLFSSSALFQTPSDLSYFSASPSIRFSNTLTGSANAIRTAYDLFLRQQVTATVTYHYEEQVVAAIPEPATWMMMLFGFGVVGAAMRRRKTVPSFA